MIHRLDHHENGKKSHHKALYGSVIMTTINALSEQRNMNDRFEKMLVDATGQGFFIESMVASDFSAFLRLNFEANLSLSLRVYVREQNKDAIYLTYWDNQLRETTSMDTEIGWLSVHVDAIKHFMLKQKRERA